MKLWIVHHLGLPQETKHVHSLCVFMSNLVSPVSIGVVIRDKYMFYQANVVISRSQYRLLELYYSRRNLKSAMFLST